MDAQLDFSKFLKKLGVKKGEDEKKEPEVMTNSTGMYEINLVPEVKHNMLRMQKTRNFVLFICLVVAGASIGLVVVLAGVRAGQEIALSNQDGQLSSLSTQLTGDAKLSSVLTIQDQLSKISEINGDKKVLSRVFGLLSVLLPSETDTITISELNVDLDTTTLTFEAQADAKREPLIDYRVLEEFKKSVVKMTYDHGRYVTAKGTEIPTRCIEEVGADGKQYEDPDGKGIYAMWNINKEEACNPDKEKRDITVPRRIWRTPQFEEWVKENKITNEGTISGVEHFESKCITYSATDEGKKKVWSATNECMLLEDENGVEISDSSNGRDSSGNLVLRFSATVVINPEYFRYENKHVMGIGPFGQNVTDSYIQTENIFEEAATDCPEGDTTCKTNTTNSTGE